MHSAVAAVVWVTLCLSPTPTPLTALDLAVPHGRAAAAALRVHNGDGEELV